MMPEVETAEMLHIELERLLCEQKILVAKTAKNRTEISTVRMSIEELGYPTSTVSLSTTTGVIKEGKRKALASSRKAKQVITL